MKGKHTLGKNERVKSRKAIETMFSNGQRFTLPPLRVVYRVSESGEPALRFGATVSAKQFKKAVDRNRIKRLLRECWRLQSAELKNGVITSGRSVDVFFIYTDKVMPGYDIIFSKMRSAIGKLEKLIAV